VRLGQLSRKVARGDHVGCFGLDFGDKYDDTICWQQKNTNLKVNLHKGRHLYLYGKASPNL